MSLRSVWEKRALTRPQRYTRGKPVVYRGTKAKFFFNGQELPLEAVEVIPTHASLGPKGISMGFTLRSRGMLKKLK